MTFVERMNTSVVSTSSRARWQRTHFFQVSALATLAEQQLSAGYARDAANLLRAAEHICFAALAPEDRPGTVPMVSPDLKGAIAAELNHLMRRAEDHWDEAESDEDEAYEAIAAIYSAALNQALSRCARRVSSGFGVGTCR